MIKWLLNPKKNDVAKYVECYWFLEKPPISDGCDYPKLNPDPSAHLILLPDNQIYRYKTDNKISHGIGSHWLYPYCKTIELDHSKPLSCIGIKFHVGALYSLKLSLTNTLKNTLSRADFTQQSLGKIQIASFDNIDGGIKPNEDALIVLAITAPDKCCETLDELLMPWLLGSYVDNHSDITRQVLPLLSNNPINELGKLLDYSQRTLERSFLRVTGLTLKQCQSMNKLEEILEFLYQRKQKDINWVDIAYQFGFSDQPHLIRYLKKQIGLTPKNYAQERGFTIDVYGGVASR
jgi:AraC-like DNA-binding protein